ncbi:uncharacterized protein MKK02DRAFT_16402, partial [Dioszegia hungarica]
YWVSKKQYWCKYCSIFIRDDAPSRRMHETGLKHSGNKERFIRDLYRNGNKAKIEKAEEAVQIARIEAVTGTGASASRLSTLDALRAQATHRPREPSRPADKLANYSSAKDLGFDDEEKTSYEIEQELKGRAGEVGGWETVEYEPTGQYTEPAEASSSKRKLGEYNPDDDNHEGFRIQKKKDPYAEDDWDPRSAIKGKAKAVKEEIKAEVKEATSERGVWAAADPSGGEFIGTWDEEEQQQVEVKPEPVKEEPKDTSGLFKKRRPPPSSRKK